MLESTFKYVFFFFHSQYTLSSLNLSATLNSLQNYSFLFVKFESLSCSALSLTITLGKMTLSGRGIPFLPGFAYKQVEMEKRHKKHTLDFKNGYAISRRGDDSKLDELDVERLGEEIRNSATLAYGGKISFLKDKSAPLVPSYVAFDKVTLTFDAYTKQPQSEGREPFHLRRVKIHYCVEDDTINVVEPAVENSGLPQGVLLKRQRIPKSSTEYYGINDFNIGQDVTFYAQTYRIVNCDAFTKKLLSEMTHIKLNEPEAMPKDEFIAAREAANPKTARLVKNN